MRSELGVDIVERASNNLRRRFGHRRNPGTSEGISTQLDESSS